MRRRLAVPALLALPALAMAIWLLRTQDVPLLVLDSSSYIRWHSMRPVGYPFFLWVVSFFDSTLTVVPYVQLTVFSVSALFLAAVTHHVFSRLWVGLAVGGSILLNVPLARMCLSILTESVFASILMVHLGVVLLLFERRSAVRWTVAGLTAFTAILVRPAGMSLVAALPLLMWLPARDLGGFARYLLPPFVVAWVAFASGNAVWRGSFGLQEQGGLSAVGHVALLLDDEVPSSLPELNHAIAGALRAHREAAEERHSFEDRFLFTLTEYNTMLAIVVQKIRDHIAQGALPPELARLHPDAAANRIAGQLVREAIRHHSRRYVVHVASHLHGFWRIPHFKRRQDVDQLRAGYQERYPKAARLTGHEDRFFAVVTARSSAFVLAKDLGLAGILLASILGLVAPLYRRDALAAAMAYASLNLHAGLLLVALVQAALWRYSVVWSPYGVVMAVAMAVAVVRRRDGGRTRDADLAA